MYIIRAIPGACGDIISAIIDNTGTTLTPKGSISFIIERRILKKPQINPNALSKLLEVYSLTYKSISSQHYIERVMTDSRYQNITVTVDSDELVDWCISRLSFLYPTVIFNKEQLKTETEFHNRYSNFKINLSDILTGNLIKKLNQYEIPVMDDKLYYKWLILNRKNFPYNFV
jgi:hypothetical protein